MQSYFKILKKMKTCTCGICLNSHSLFLNPIENIFSIWKNLVLKTACETEGELHHHHHHQSSFNLVQSPVTGGGQMHSATSATLLIASLHLHQSVTSYFFKPILLMLLSTCSLHFILGRPCLRFPSISCTVPLPLSKHLPQVVLKMIIPPHTICLCQLICCFLQSQHVHKILCILLVYQLYIAHRHHHRSFCSSQNNYFIFSQTPRFASI